MGSKKILLVEDDPNFGTVLKDYLALHDYNITHAKDGIEGLIEFKNNDFDLCILDVMMPRKDGFSLAADIRSTNKEIPIIFLTAKTKAILQRKESDSNKESDEFEFNIGKFFFNSKLRHLSFDGGENQKLSPKESKLLKMLAVHKNDLMPRELALTKIWRDDNYFTSRSMDVYIAKLRKYLKSDEKVEILNIHGEGFRLVEN